MRQCCKQMPSFNMCLNWLAVQGQLRYLIRISEKFKHISVTETSSHRYGGNALDYTVLSATRQRRTIAAITVTEAGTRSIDACKDEMPNGPEQRAMWVNYLLVCRKSRPDWGLSASSLIGDTNALTTGPTRHHSPRVELRLG